MARKMSAWNGLGWFDMGATVFAKHFHPMAGHCADGTVVVFSDGSRGRIDSTINGWRISHNKELVCCGHNASAVTDYIVQAEKDATP